MTKLPPGLSYEGKVKHIIERIVLEVIAPDCASPADIRAALREFCKAVLRLNELELPSDAVIDEVASNTEQKFADTNRHLVEVPDTYAVARWPRDADVATIARAMRATLTYEPHGADTTPLRRALESVIDHEQRASSTERAR